MDRSKGGDCTKEALVFFLALSVAPLVNSSLAQETEEIEEIEVIGVTPTRGVGLPEELIPTSVQRATSDDLDQSQSLDLTEFMNRNLGGVTINAAQNSRLREQRLQP